MYSYVLTLFFSNKYLVVTAAEGMISIQVQTAVIVLFFCIFLGSSFSVRRVADG